MHKADGCSMGNRIKIIIWHRAKMQDEQMVKSGGENVRFLVHLLVVKAA